MNQLIDVVSKEAFGKIKKEVPFVKGAEATFYSDVSGNFGEQLAKKRKELGEADSGYWSAVQTIADWNFSDKEGKKLPITTESLKKLPLKLQKWIFEKSTEAILVDVEVKKKSPVVSSKR